VTRIVYKQLGERQTTTRSRRRTKFLLFCNNYNIYILFMYIYISPHCRGRSRLIGGSGSSARKTNFRPPSTRTSSRTKNRSSVCRSTWSARTSSSSSSSSNSRRFRHVAYLRGSSKVSRVVGTSARGADCWPALRRSEAYVRPRPRRPSPCRPTAT